MSRFSVEEAIKRHAAAIERLQPDPVRLNAALAGAGGGAESRPVARHRWTPLAVGLACLVLGGAVAGAATGLLDPAVDSFLGGGNPPGRQLSGEDVPSWLQPAPGFNAPGEVSVVASAGDEHLYAYRQRDSICFDYGHHVGECRSSAEWRQELEAQPLFLRGPVGESTWFGLVAAGIAKVRVDYASGEPTEIVIRNGGFIANVDRARDPQRMVALDTSGEEVASRPLVLAVEGR